MNTLFGSIFGQQNAGWLSPQNQSQAQQAYNSYGQSGLANQSAFNAQQYSQQYTQQLLNGLINRAPAEWMIDGKALSFEQFVDTLCPDADDPMRSFLILKYKK